MEDRNRTERPDFSVDTDLTMPGRRDRKACNRFEIGDLIINRYRVLSELGQGGMGVVYRCFDETAGVEIALKALPPELSHNTLEMEDIKENFQLVSSLVHQNIAIYKQLEKDNANGNYYLIMECCEGEDLRRWIKRQQKEGVLNLDVVLPIIKQVAEALDYAHQQKIIHRDIKPGNIVINNDGLIKVLDFGLAAQIHTSMTRVSMAYHGTSGTGPYMSPEQWRGKKQGASADQYALAVMAYEMLSGSLPFESPDPAVLKQAILEETPDKIEFASRAVNAALQRAMSKNPEDRFASCSDFVSALSNKNINIPVNRNIKHIKKLVAAILALACLCFAGYQIFDLISEGSGENKQSAAKEQKKEKKVYSPVTIEEAHEELKNIARQSPQNFKGEMSGIFQSFLKMPVSLENYDNLKKDQQFKFACYVSALGGVKTIQWLLDQKKINVNQIGDGGLLHFASLSGNLKMMELLIDYGANCSLADKDGQVPLSWAMGKKDCLPAIKLLIESGADVNYGGKRESPLEEAYENELKDVIRYLRAHGAVNKFSGTVKLPDYVHLEMSKIPAGTFFMGSDAHRTLRRVKLTKEFWLGKYEVTQAQWIAVMGENPSYYKGSNRPVESVSWIDAKNFCKELNRLYADRLPDGYQFDLPTEAQWEYACRAGTRTSYSYGDSPDSNKMHDNNYAPTVNVKSLDYKNAFDLYVMHGNVGEWCSDWYGDYTGNVTDPAGPATGTKKVCRGGYGFMTSSARRGFCPRTTKIKEIGFRLALVPIR